MTDTKVNTVPVWDLFIRFFHWILVLSVTVAIVTAMILNATWIMLHIIAGITASALVFARIIWGFFGPTHARFKSFVVGPAAVLEHLKEFRGVPVERHLGHNPLGALMIVAKFVVILFIFLSGLVVLGGVFKTGPMAFNTSYLTGDNILGLHRYAGYLMIAMIFAHIAGAIFESIRTKESLPKSMITGKKESREGDHKIAPIAARPLIAVVLVALGLGGMVWASVYSSAKPAMGIPEISINEDYVTECGDCHIAFHPSLMNSANWGDLMANLDDHFGEDAYLDEETAAGISAWLQEFSSEKFDSKPSHVFATVDPEAPYTITKTPFWVSTHEDISEDVFKQKPIYAKTNCAACHSDAESGRFYPANISIPKETSNE